VREDVRDSGSPLMSSSLVSYRGRGNSTIEMATRFVHVNLTFLEFPGF